MSESPGKDMEKVDEKYDFDGGLEQQESVHEGELKYQKLSWGKLTICLLVTAIALGALSIPSAFAAVGMVAGVILCIGIGFIAVSIRTCFYRPQTVAILL